MSKKEYVKPPKPVNELTTQEIRAWLNDLEDSVIIRSLLIAEIEAIRSGVQRERRTLRGLWYDEIKPVLSRAGILNNKTSGGKDVPWDEKLSDYLADLVRMGITSYEELLIVDGSRQRQAAQPINTQLVDVQMVGAHYPWIILFTEKDTIWGELANIADLYGVSAISGGGQPANACTENTVRAIVRSESFQAKQPEAITIISITDYDPAGYFISEAQYNQVRDAVRAMDKSERGSLRGVRRERLGITPDQLTPEELEVKSYEPKPKGLQKWFEQTGGVNGKRLGLELDALGLSRIRAMYARGIENNVNLADRLGDLPEAFIDLVACNLLLPEFEKKRQAMIKAVKESDLWVTIGEKPISSSLFYKAAQAGQYWIAPLQTLGLYAEYRAEVESTMQEVISEIENLPGE